MDTPGTDGFEPIDIRAIPDDQLDDIIGGGVAASPHVKAV